MVLLLALKLVPLGLSATYGQTGNKVAAGAVQSVIGVTFIYE